MNHIFFYFNPLFDQVSPSEITNFFIKGDLAKTAAKQNTQTYTHIHELAHYLKLKTLTSYGVFF